MTSPADLLDLDAAKRERAVAPIVIRWNGENLEAPGELPADVFDPFLSPEFDLLSLVKALLDNTGSDDDYLTVLLAVLDKNPNLGSTVLAALKEAYALLLGAENYAAFLAGKPSLIDYIALTRGLLRKYGVSLGEAFASPASSENAGATPKPTSPTSTPDSTPATAGADQNSSPAS